MELIRTGSPVPPYWRGLGTGGSRIRMPDLYTYGFTL